jgi:nicotinamidase/pyrazinamidase
MKRRSIQLLLIDPQNDFTDPNGSLFVAGAPADCDRVAKMISRLNSKIDDIHVSLDSHIQFSIFHPKFWVDSSGNNPAPFTPIFHEDVEKGKWQASIPSLTERAKKYITDLQATGRYIHLIWPEHCLIGGWGHSIQSQVFDSLQEWSARKPGRIVDFVTKGSNPFTEHFSIIKAEVPDPKDPSTQLNVNLIKSLIEADDLLIAGEASSHCVANTVRDIADNFGSDSLIKKLVYLTDASSPVGGDDGTGKTFKQYEAEFVKDLVARGMRTSTTVDYLK